MIVESAAYVEGSAVATTREVAEVPALLEHLRHRGDFVWVGLQDPTFEEFQVLQDAFGLHPLAVEDAVVAHQRPKVDRYGDAAFLVLKALRYDDPTSQVETSEVSAFVGPRYLITVRHGTWPSLTGVRDRAHETPEMLRHGPLGAVYHLVDAVVDQYQSIADELVIDVDQVEASVFSEERTSDSGPIYFLKRELQEMRRAVVPIQNPISDVMHGSRGYRLPEELRPYYRDVADHLVHVAGIVGDLDHLLDNVLQAHATQISMQQNDDMRKLAAYAAMFAGPTLIAGIYGMNFRDMPELHWALGYPLALLVMAGVVLVLWRAFKRSGWL
ncbi:UNVERIFIED_CONTAM: hypothetical protein LK11_43800 [Mumia flava]|nr:magnesium/cobalt transporter CorA [Mumia flava]